MNHDSIDKILQGNTGNIIYLKSTDDSMLDTLEKMSGIRHESYRESKSVTFDAKKMINPADSKVTETTNVKERPVISKNDMLLIPPSNEMVFGKGNPIWDRNQLALPMSYQLHNNRLPHAPGVPGYALNTVPSSSNTDDFDILGNQPNFYDMVSRRVRQARIADQVKKQYQKVYGLSEDQLNRIKPDVLAAQLMEGINEQLAYNDGKLARQQKENAEADDEQLTPEEELANMQAVADEMGDDDDDGDSALSALMQQDAQDNEEFSKAQANASKDAKEQSTPRYAQGTISREALISSGSPQHTAFDAEIALAYQKSIQYFKQDDNFRVSDSGTLMSKDGQTRFIESVDDEDSDFGKDNEDWNQNATDKNGVKTIQNENDPAVAAELKYHPTDDFYRYLTQLDNWNDIAKGAFDSEMYQAYQLREHSDQI